jgi:5-methylcytosine-specific restriction endonuclease McrA
MDNKRLVAIREQKYREQNGRCYWCGCEMRPPSECTQDRSRMASADHLVPISRGGARLDPANIVAACISCNGKRGSNHLTAEQLGNHRA